MENDDILDNINTEAEIEIGGINQSELNSANDSDWFSVTFEAGTTYRISGSMNGPAGTYRYNVRDADGNLILEGQEFDVSQDTTGPSPSFFFTPDVSGTFFIEVVGFDIIPNVENFATSYALFVAEAEDVEGDTIDTAFELEIDADRDYFGTIAFPGDLDIFQINTQAGETYFIDTRPDFGAETIDTRLLDGNGNLIADFSNGSQVNAFTASIDGPIYVEISIPDTDETISSDETGNYRIGVTSASESDSVLGNRFSTATLDLFGETLSGTTEVIGDSDWYAFDIEAGDIAQFAITLGSVDLDIYNTDGVLVASSPSGFRGGAASNDLFFSTSNAGTYFLSVTGLIPRAGVPFTGEYNISSVELFDDIGNTPDTATEIITNSGPVDGVFEGAGGPDVFSLEIIEGGVYEITTAGRTPTFDFIDADGEAIVLTGANGSTFSSATSRAAFVADFTGTIYISARVFTSSAVNTTFGEYSFEVTAEIPSEVNFIDGTNGADDLRGTSGVDDIVGLGGNDELRGFGGDDKLFGGNGTDKLFGGNGADELFGQGGRDFLYGQNGDDLLEGGGGNDFLRGGNGDDVLLGGSEADWLRGGVGADILNGGGGTDWADYITSSSGVTANLQNNTASGGDAQGDSFISIERLYGSNHDDSLTGNGAANYIRGAAGDDVLSGKGGNDVLQGGLGADMLNGGSGRDFAYYVSSAAGLTIDLGDASNNTGEAAGDSYISIENVLGSRFDDFIYGDAGNNFLRGLQGDDKLFGEGGDDTLRGDQGADILDGGAGKDWANYATSNAAVTVSLGTGAASGGHAQGDSFHSIERLFGSRYDDVLTGDSGANYLRGHLGDDTLNGGAGSDYLQGGLGADALNGGTGTDWAYYVSAKSGVTADLGQSANNTGEAAGDTYSSIENLRGSRYDDVLIGNNSANYIVGGTGDDVMDGSGGRDTLRGDGGNDLLIGGAGRDTFLFRDGDGFDTIADFTFGQDTIDLRSFDFGSFADLNLVEDGGSVFLYISEHQSIEFTNIDDVGNFSAADFLL